MKIETTCAATFRRFFVAPTTWNLKGEVRPQHDRTAGMGAMGAADLAGRAAIATPGNPAWSRLIT